MAADAIAGRAEAVGEGVGEELNFRLAKHVDGLHGIANQKDGAVFAEVPGGEQRSDESVLAARGVLELVDEEMAGVGADTGCTVRSVFEDVLGGEGDLG